MDKKVFLLYHKIGNQDILLSIFESQKSALEDAETLRKITGGYYYIEPFYVISD